MTELTLFGALLYSSTMSISHPPVLICLDSSPLQILFPGYPDLAVVIMHCLTPDKMLCSSPSPPIFYMNRSSSILVISLLDLLSTEFAPSVSTNIDTTPASYHFERLSIRIVVQLPETIPALLRSCK